MNSNSTMNVDGTMNIEEVEFYSDGHLLRGLLKSPASSGNGRLPVIIQGPGWLETVGDPLSLQFHEGLVTGGYAVLQFDFRGFGMSEGEPGWLVPQDQQRDISNAITYVSTRSDLDIGRLGLFAVGGLAGGNAIYVADRDERVKAICAQTVVADGVQWLHEQRREWEWVEFKNRVEADRRARVLYNKGTLVDPTEEIMIATPERKKKGMPLRGNGFHLASVDFLADFRPVDIVGRISPCALLMTAVTDDVVTPEHHAQELFAAARAPKRLLIQKGVSHYEAYTANYGFLMQQFLQWYNSYLDVASADQARRAVDDVVVIETRGGDEVDGDAVLPARDEAELTALASLKGGTDS